MEIVKLEAYNKWHSKINNDMALKKINNIQKMIKLKNYFGNAKNISKDKKNAKGLWEAKIDEGEGYRIYYIIINDKAYFLDGSFKKDQQKVINRIDDNFALIEKEIDKSQQQKTLIDNLKEFKQKQKEVKKYPFKDIGR
jgi:putative addiction module killer protein